MSLDTGFMQPEGSEPLRRMRRRRFGIRSWLCALACIVVPAAAAQAQQANPLEPEGPAREPLFSLDSPLGPIDYVTGRGLHLGRTGITVGGFSTLEINREEREPGFLDLDSINFLLLWKPVDFFSAFAELEVGNLFSLELNDGQVRSDPDLVVERLYGDVSWNDALNARVGKFQTPVGIWNLVPAEPFTWTATDPVLFESAFDDHQTGGALFGSFYPGSNQLEYWVYGQFVDALDSGDTPLQADRSVGARLRYGGPLGDWAVGASYLSSELDGRWNFLGGLDGFWQVGAFEFQSEFTIVRGDIPGRNLWDVYVQGVYNLGDLCSCLDSVNLVARYEHFDPAGWDVKSDLWDVGAAWRPEEFLILKADYRFADHQSGAGRRGVFASFSVLF